MSTIILYNILSTLHALIPLLTNCHVRISPPCYRASRLRLKPKLWASLVSGA